MLFQQLRRDAAKRRFRFVAVTKNATLKMALCGVPAELLENHGAVSAEAAEALAQGVRKSLNSSIGLAITGIAGPGGGSPEKPVGLVYIGVSDGVQNKSRHRIMPGDRESIRERSTYLALSWLRRFLMQTESP